MNNHHLCPRCKAPMMLEEKSSTHCMGVQARIVCSDKCGVVGEWQQCCIKDNPKNLCSAKRAWLSWKKERSFSKR